MWNPKWISFPAASEEKALIGQEGNFAASVSHVVAAERFIRNIFNGLS